MKRRSKRHNPEQIARKLSDADEMIAAGKPLEDVYEALKISEQTFNRWRNQYDGTKAAEAKRLQELEIENDRLKKLLADAELDKELLNEALWGSD